MKKNTNQKNFIFLLSLILIGTIIWVASSVYHNLTTSTIEVPLAGSIKPIDGSFDTETIDEIKKRKQVEVTSDIITPVESLQTEENASPSAQFDTNSDLDISTESAETNL